jgi:hypothetical protein
MNKHTFDMELSLKMCPPKYPKGVRFIKRIIIDRSNVTYPATHQVRQLNVDMKKVPEIRDSFEVSGYIHSESPPTIKVDPLNKSRFIGLSGYHRNAAVEQLGWNTMIYDVLEFDSPLVERIHCSVTNANRLPFISMTKSDYVKQVLEAVKNQEIPNDDMVVQTFISSICPDKNEAFKKNIFDKFRKNKSYSATLVCYTTQSKGENSTHEYAMKYKLPNKGDSTYATTSRLGYIVSTSIPKTAIHESHKLSRNYNGQKVEFYGFIDSPLQGAGLKNQRQNLKEGFEECILNECKSIQYLIEKVGHKVSLSEIRKAHPVVFVGFLHQDITPDNQNFGNPKEDGVVDVNGNAIYVPTYSKTPQGLEAIFSIIGNDLNVPQDALDILS